MLATFAREIKSEEKRGRMILLIFDDGREESARVDVCEKVRVGGKNEMRMSSAKEQGAEKE